LFLCSLGGWLCIPQDTLDWHCWRDSPLVWMPLGQLLYPLLHLWNEGGPPSS
jgi:hypothetical protein